MRKHFSVLLTLVLLLGLVVLFAFMQKQVICTSNTDKEVSILDSVDQSSAFLSQLIVELNQSATEIPEEYQDKIETARAINEDVQGWIYIEEFGIDYPVLYSTDNSTYLRTNIYGEYDVAGSIYLDANYGSIYSPVKLIHGHNMKNDTMFHRIPTLLQETTLDAAPLIYYCDDLGLKVFKIFSVFSVNAKEESVIVSEYITLEDLLELKQSYVDRTWVPVSEIPDGSELLMLNTCWYGESGTEHFLHCIVVAGRIS